MDDHEHGPSCRGTCWVSTRPENVRYNSIPCRSIYYRLPSLEEPTPESSIVVPVLRHSAGTRYLQLPTVGTCEPPDSMLRMPYGAGPIRRKSTKHRNRYSWDAAHPCLDHSNRMIMISIENRMFHQLVGVSKVYRSIHMVSFEVLRRNDAAPGMKPRASLPSRTRTNHEVHHVSNSDSLSNVQLRCKV